MQGVHATRARLKRRHIAAELLISRKAEALVALAEWHASAGRQRHAACRLARCSCSRQFHDTLCGCCADDVARDQESRLDAVSAMGRELVRSSLHALTRHSPDAAREHPEMAIPALADLESGATGARRERSSWKSPASAATSLWGRLQADSRTLAADIEPFVLIGAGGEVTPVQVLSVTPGTERIDAARHYPDQDAVDRVLVALQLPPLPGLGFAHFSVRRGHEAPAAAKLEARRWPTRQ